jgi:hypothetical protein
MLRGIAIRPEESHSGEFPADSNRYENLEQAC